jgi:crossover junction endodeoxyribonuclease RusA
MNAGKSLTIELPLSPSVNHYWGRHGKITYVSKAGKDFRVNVQAAVLEQCGCYPRLTGRLCVAVRVHPADRRRQDLDNRLKSLLDCLAHAGIYEDDSQIDRLTIERGPIVKPAGAMQVVITELARET